MIVAFGGAATVTLSIILAAILSRLLSGATYGTFRQVLYVYTTLTVLFQVGLPKAASYFLPRLPPGESKATLWTIMLLLFGNGLLFSGILYLGADYAGKVLNNVDLPSFLRLYSPIPTLLFPTLALEGACMSNSQARTYAVFQIFSKLVTLIAVVAPILLGHSLETAIATWSVVSVIICAAAIWLMFAPYRGCPMHAGGPTVWQILHYSVPLLFATVLATLLASADRFLVSRFFGPEVFATYVNGAMELPLITVVTSSTMTVLLPSLSRLAAGGATCEIAGVWSRATEKTAAVLYPCAAFAFFFAPDAMRMLYSEQYVASSSFFRIYLAIALVRVVAYAPLLLAIGSLNWYVAGHILGCVIAWIGAAALCEWLGNPVWAAVCFVAGVYAMIIIFLVGIRRRLSIPLTKLLPLKRLLAIMLVSVSAAGMAWLLTVRIVGTSGAMSLWRLACGVVLFTMLFFTISRVMGCHFERVVLPVRKCFGANAK